MTSHQQHEPQSVLKVLGCDFECANFMLGSQCTGGFQREAADRLLREIAGYPLRAAGGTAIEHGRRFLSSSAGSWYIDSDHLEGNLPEHTRALDHPIVLHGAGLRQARLAQVAANRRLPAGEKIHVVANCSDGRTAWGSHLNVLVSRGCFQDVLYSKPHYASFLATHLVTSIPFTGQGLVGAANGRPACEYQLSQRADWLVQLTGQQTTYDRPVLNLRDEPHASAELARLHIICHDLVLCPVANILKAGTCQLVLAMLEAGWLDPTICLDDPVAAASAISRDLQLDTQLATTVPGRSMTAVEIQAALAELAGEFVAATSAEAIVPDAEAIVNLWRETVDMLRHRELEGLARRCDAWLKYLLLDRQRGRRNLSWSSPQVKMLDSMFASLDIETSLFFAVAADDGVDRMPTEQQINTALQDPPHDTRAYFRAEVLRRFGGFVSQMNWDRIAFQVPSGRNWWSTATIPMPDPRRWNAAQTRRVLAQAESLTELVNAANDEEVASNT